MFTKDELNQISVGIEALITSAQRAQKTGKNPMISEVHKKLENQLNQLKSKVNFAIDQALADEVKPRK